MDQGMNRPCGKRPGKKSSFDCKFICFRKIYQNRLRPASKLRSKSAKIKNYHCFFALWEPRGSLGEPRGAAGKMARGEINFAWEWHKFIQKILKNMHESLILAPRGAKRLRGVSLFVSPGPAFAAPGSPSGNEWIKE